MSNLSEASQGSTPVSSRAIYLWLAAGQRLERHSWSHLYNLNSSFNYYLASSAVNEWTETGGNLSCLRQKKKWTNVARGEERVTEDVLLSHPIPVGVDWLQCSRSVIGRAGPASDPLGTVTPPPRYWRLSASRDLYF